MNDSVTDQLKDLAAKIDSLQHQIENLTLPVGAVKSSAISMAQENKSKNITDRLLGIGFGVAMVIAILCLMMSGLYLFRYLDSTNSGIDTLIKSTNTASELSILSVSIAGRLQMARFALLSCGAFAGLSFGFLGFALFLIGIKEEIDVEAQSDNYRIKFARMSPGALVILIAAVLIGVCITRQLSFGAEYRSSQDAASENAATPSNENFAGSNETKNSANSNNSSNTRRNTNTFFSVNRGSN
jgi:hypothetical protein